GVGGDGEQGVGIHRIGLAQLAHAPAALEHHLAILDHRHGDTRHLEALARRFHPGAKLGRIQHGLRRSGGGGRLLRHGRCQRHQAQREQAGQAQGRRAQGHGQLRYGCAPILGAAAVRARGSEVGAWPMQDPRAGSATIDIRSSPATAMSDLFDPAPAASGQPRIRVGIGGWTYAPWRGGVFYPEKLVQRRELEYASRHVTAIEINGTYYGAQKPDTYARWRDETPPGFVFTAKAPKRIMASRRLAGTGAQVEDFVGGIATLGDRLGAILWQFDRGQSPSLDALGDFLALLPRQAADLPLRHALELRDAAL